MNNWRAWPSLISLLSTTLYLQLILVSCQHRASLEQGESIPIRAPVYQPAIALGDLFHDVQMAGIFDDSKTLVDCIPLSDPQQIIKQYHLLKDGSVIDLREFVDRNFEIPGRANGGIIVSKNDMTEHIEALWPLLTRSPDKYHGLSSLLPLPHPYIVPGGRFREIYYWDSYFTMLGLMDSGEDSLAINMIRNFAYLINTYGFIPNGNRSYYLGRSQPPFFSVMVMLWANHHGLDQALPFLPQIRQEYEFWMQGADALSESGNEHQRVVMLPGGEVLNRYWDNFSQPRPESYREDYELAEAFPENKRAMVYRNLRAGAESGWDYSSRWFSDGESLDSIITTQILPVDLNCLMYFMENTIAGISHYSGDQNTANEYQQKRDNRGEAIKKYFWDSETGYFTDYNLNTNSATRQFSAAGMAPLFFQIATEDQAQRALIYLKENLLYPGGVVSSNNDTGQQWDFPNGWAPQQWMAIKGAENYQSSDLANEIAARWLALTGQVFTNTGKMMEKYNVVDLSLTAGGGEYPTQDGFGWTNGVTLAIQSYLSTNVDTLSHLQPTSTDR